MILDFNYINKDEITIIKDLNLGFTIFINLKQALTNLSVPWDDFDEIDLECILNKFFQFIPFQKSHIKIKKENLRESISVTWYVKSKKDFDLVEIKETIKVKIKKIKYL